MPKGVYDRTRSVSDKQAFTVRVDADLYLKIRDFAAAEHRTIGAQIEYDLKKLYQRR